MRRLIEYLQRLDFSESEARIYIILLRKGPMTVSEIAEKSKLNRTAIYGYINNLLDKGILAKSKSGSNKVFANPPDHLQYLVEEKISHANLLKDQLFPIVTTLNSTYLRFTENHESDMRYFKGRNGIRAIYEDCLKAQEVRAYFNPIEIKQYLPGNVQLFQDALNRNSKMKIFEIVENSSVAEEFVSESGNKGQHIWKLLPKGVKLTSNDILIYEGKVVIVNLLGEDSFYGFILHNKDYYNNSKQLFDLLWKLLPNPPINS